MAFLVSRLAQSILVLFGVSVVVFFLARLSGDPVVLLMPAQATNQEIAEMRERLGLSDPLPVQLVRFLGLAARGDFGTSLRYREPSLGLVLSRLPATLELTAASMVVALVIAIPAGIVAAYHPGRGWDRLAMSVALFGYSVPTFWLGIMLILLVSVRLGLLPSSGRGGLEYLVLPAITLGMYSTAIIARLLRRSLVGVLQQDYIKTARAKGLTERLVLTGHALKNASIPVVTVFGLQLGALIGGAVVTETVFAYPGMGLLVVTAIQARDFPVVQAFVVVSAAVVVALNLVVDLLYFQLDPRIRVG
jgi:ABC-type dipeptide/oligopeptide/nickel transport system permease component